MVKAIIFIRLDDKVKQELKRRADLMGLSLTAYIRMILIEHTTKARL